MPRFQISLFLWRRSRSRAWVASSLRFLDRRERERDARTHTHAHTKSFGRVISLSRRPLSKQRTTSTRDEHPYPQQDRTCNPRIRAAADLRLRPQRSLRSAFRGLNSRVFVVILSCILATTYRYWASLCSPHLFLDQHAISVDSWSHLCFYLCDVSVEP